MLQKLVQLWMLLGRDSHLKERHKDVVDNLGKVVHHALLAIDIIQTRHLEMNASIQSKMQTQPESSSAHLATRHRD